MTAYYAFYDQLLASSWLGEAAGRTAWLAGGLMGFCGIPAQVSGGILRTGGSAWLVTPECVTTPLIPIALAAVLAAPMSWQRKVLSLLALPLAFQVLAVARLMVLALPRLFIGSQGIAVHAFYQLLLAGLLVVWVAWWQSKSGILGAAQAIAAGALAGVALGALDLRLLRPALQRLVETLHLGHGYVDSQGALVLLPAFQVGLLVALWNARRPLPRLRELGLATPVVIVGGASTLWLLGELSLHAAIELPVVVLRSWSLALPILVAIAMGWMRAPQREPLGDVREAPAPAS